MLKKLFIHFSKRTLKVIINNFITFTSLENIQSIKVKYFYKIM